MKKENGSYTVEAAFVVPMILGIVFMIMYLLLLHHDRVILRAELSNLMFLKARNQEISEDYTRILEKRLWIMEVTKGSVEKNTLQYTGKVEAKSKVSIPILTFMLNKNQKLEMTESYPVIQPDQTRRYRKQKSKEEGN